MFVIFPHSTVNRTREVDNMSFLFHGSFINRCDFVVRVQLITSLKLHAFSFLFLNIVYKLSL